MNDLCREVNRLIINAKSSLQDLTEVIISFKLHLIKGGFWSLLVRCLSFKILLGSWTTRFGYHSTFEKYNNKLFEIYYLNDFILIFNKNVI